MLRRQSLRKSYGGDKAFTLTEFGIILGVFSLIMGAIWAASGSLWVSYHTHKSTHEITQIAQNIRDQYKGVQIPNTWIPTGSEITQTLDAVNAFPLEMRRNPALSPGDATETIDNDFGSVVGGSTRVFYVGAAGANNVPSAGSCTIVNVPCFRIWFYGLSSDACIKLLGALPIDDDEVGIANMGVTNTSGACTAGTCVTQTAVLASGAAAWCNESKSDNTVFWDFKLH